MKITVIASTYNAEEWLEKVLHGYRFQTWRDFELIVADDGSRASTREMVERLAADYPVPLRHVWHEDAGYRRQEILNRAILESSHDYILFTDGDCIPRRDFVGVHAALAEPGRFLSGGYCKLSMKASKAITLEDIRDGRCFQLDWLRALDRVGFSPALKLGAGTRTGPLLDAITTTRATFNNCNSSAWKQDLLAINGYDERMKYGGPDRELGERLENHGVRGKQIRHRAVCVHLDHARSYKTSESIQRNLAIRAQTRAQRITRTPYGIEKVG
ncbi:MULTISPECIES: glycosyltransferase family 2 protein [unclassified Pseudoxanthomonas]|jgi:glycosyltransferase involved in cell wall biosynthesis|uniref:glycosyltransferase family 2 protein n=1 Tax=unclassified Pseudoxanthomonas TaxID=2645906 RepID=UPI00307CEB5A